MNVTHAQNSLTKVYAFHRDNSLLKGQILSAELVFNFWLLWMGYQTLIWISEHNEIIDDIESVSNSSRDIMERISGKSE
jgi:hypothetical protein